MEFSRRLIFACLASIAAGSAFAITPEAGLYFDAAESGKGFYIETQGGIGLIIFYAGSPETGKPEYYLATGTLGPHPLPLDEPNYLGIDPADGFGGDIVRLTDSVPCLTCPGYGYVPSQHAETVGHVDVNFRILSRANMLVTWKDGSSFSYSLERENFGFPLAKDIEGVAHSYDLLGEWVFVDETDLSRNAWRFNFTQVTVTADPYQGSMIPAFEYADVQRQAVLHCNVSFGCELHQGNDVLFSARYEDIAPRKIQAFLGPLPNLAVSALYRTSEVVIGLRVQPSHVPGS